MKHIMNRMMTFALALVLIVSAFAVPGMAAGKGRAAQGRTGAKASARSGARASSARKAANSKSAKAAAQAPRGKGAKVAAQEARGSAATSDGLIPARLPEEITYKRTGDGGSSGADSVTSTVAWDLKNHEVSAYEQPYNAGSAPWLLAFLYTGTETPNSALEARLGYDGMKQNQDMILASNPLITSGIIKTLVVVDNKGYQQTADQYRYSFQVVNRQLKRVDCSKVEAGLYGTDVRRTNSWVTYDYDSAGRVVAIRHSDGRVDTFAYGEDGRLESFTVNKLTLKVQYDGDKMIPANQVTKTTYTRDGGRIVGVSTELPGVYTESYKISTWAE